MTAPFEDDVVISPDFYGDHGHPFEAFAWLRSNDPIRQINVDGFRPFWAITKHADIVEIEKQPDCFVSEPRPLLMREAATPEMRQEIMVEIFKRLQDSPKILEVLASTGQGGLIRSLVQMDPPDHTRYRALVQPWFKPTNIKALEARLADITGSILDDMCGEGGERTLDFVQEIGRAHV